MHELVAAINGRKGQSVGSFEPLYRDEYMEMKRRCPDVAS